MKVEAKSSVEFKSSERKETVTLWKNHVTLLIWFTIPSCSSIDMQHYGKIVIIMQDFLYLSVVVYNCGIVKYICHTFLF